jgi:tetratricopeptide (TPR) repeat protein
MEETDIQKRVSDLELEVDALKKLLKADAEPRGLMARSQKLARLLIANWVLLSFVSALLIAGYVKYRFGIDYFESYENIATNRKVSLIYQQMGDRLMAKSEWRAAEEAYSEALKTNPNNPAATRGIAMAQVFQPVTGEKFPAPEVEDAKLKYLEDQFGEDYQIDYLKAIRYEATGDFETALGLLQKCIDKQPKEFSGCYMQRGSIGFYQSKVDDARANYQLAVNADPESSMAQNNLAACSMLLGDFPAAQRGFKEANRISPTVLSAINLGEADWYLRDFAGALEAHQIAAYNIEKPLDPQDRYLAGTWTSGFLPLHAGDLETIKYSMPVDTLEQKKTFLHFEVAIDYALLERFDEADKEFEAGLKTQLLPGHKRLVENRLESVSNMVQMSADSKKWLDEHRTKLD